MYTDIAEWTRIRRQVQTAGISVRQIASKSGIARKTVQKMTQFSVPPGYRMDKLRERPKLGPWMQLIDQIVEEDASKPTTESRSATEIWARLKESSDFNAGYSTVKDYAREARRRIAASSRSHQSSTRNRIPLDTFSKSDDPSQITYLAVQSLPKHQAVRFLRSLFAGNQPVFDPKLLDQAFAGFAKNAGGTETQRKRQAALIWMWRILQGQTTPESLAEEIGEQPDARDLLCAATEGKLSMRNRALCILGKERGISVRMLSDLLHISRETAVSYCLTYRQSGWGSLVIKNKRSSTKYDKVSNKQAVFSLLHSPRSAHGINRTTWTMTNLQDVLRSQGASMCKDVIRSIIKQAGYRWRCARVVLTRRDPEYRAKLDAIEEILSRLKPDEAFFSIDEYGPFAIKQKGGTKRVAPGEHYVVPQWQKSKGWTILTAALELAGNQVTHFYSRRKNTDEMIMMADMLRFKYRSCSTIYLSWDAASWHISKRLIAYLGKLNEQASRDGYPIVKTAPLPAGAQFLNVVESVFSGMARAIIHNSDYASVDVAKSAIDRYFAERNKHFFLHPKRAPSVPTSVRQVAPQQLL